MQVKLNVVVGAVALMLSGVAMAQDLDRENWPCGSVQWLDCPPG